MKKYILTLAPVDGDGTTATAQIDVNGDGPRIKQITFTAADGGYLPKMPFDLEGFIAAVMPGTTRSAPATIEPPVAAAPVRTAAVPDRALAAPAARVPAERAGTRTAGRNRPASTPVKTTTKAAAPGQGSGSQESHRREEDRPAQGFGCEQRAGL